MDSALYLQRSRNLMALLRFALGGDRPPVKEMDGWDIPSLMKLAKSHSLTALAAYGLDRLGRGTAETEALLGGIIRRNILFEQEKNAVIEDLKKAGIWYCPLKGSILKRYYPEWTLREMSDVDILYDIDREADVRKLMEERGFETVLYARGAADEYYKQPLYNFEMHRYLFGGHIENDYKAYFNAMLERMTADPQEPLHRDFTPEDFYIYFVGHAYKHFASGGTGLRTLVDEAVYLQEFDTKLDKGYIQTELRKIKAADFEALLRDLAEKLLTEAGGREALTPPEEEAFLYIASSGTYGTLQHQVEKDMRDGLPAYLKKRLLLPMRTVEEVFPFFYKHKFLLPFLPLYRLGKGLAKQPRKLLSELKYMFDKQDPSGS